MTKNKKEKIPLVSESEYRRMKTICNKFERNWRSKHPKEHKENSKELLTAIVKTKQPIKKKTKLTKTQKQIVKKVENNINKMLENVGA